MLLIIEILFIVLLSMILVIIYQHEGISSRKTAPQALAEEYWSGKERRQHFRFQNDLEVGYAVQKRSQPRSRGKTLDISEGGMKLMLDEKLSKGTILDLKVALPNSNKFAELEGEVMWTEEIDGVDTAGKRFFYAGIKFIAMKGPADMKFMDHIRSLATTLQQP